MADLLTLSITPLDYRVGAPEIAYRPTVRGRARTLVTIGGSFSYQVLDPMTGCGLFRQPAA